MAVNLFDYFRSSPDKIARRIERDTNRLKALSIPTYISEFDGKKNFYTLASIIGSVGSNYDCRTVQGQADAYNNCAPLNAVINRWLRASANAKWYVEDVNGKTINSSSSAVRLLDNPNPVQSWREFAAQTAAMILVHGQAYWYKVGPVGMRTISAIWVLPNYLVTERVTGRYTAAASLGDIVTGYNVTLGGTTQSLLPSEIIKIRDISANFFTGATATVSTTDGITSAQSRIYAMSDVINSLVAAYQAKKNTIVKRGPLGMLVSEGGNNVMSLPLTSDEEDELHAKLSRYGMQDGQRQEIITRHAMRWVQITKGIKELMLFEEVEAGTREICSAMDYPFELLGYSAGSSLAGGGKYAEVKKLLYTDSIIPVMAHIGDAVTKHILPPGQYFRPYYDHLDVFQSSRREDAEAMKIYNEACRVAVEAGAMTLQQWQDGLNNYL